MQGPQFKRLDPKQIPQQLQSLLTNFRQDLDDLVTNKAAVNRLLECLDQQGQAIECLFSPCAHLKNVIGSADWRECYRQCQPMLTDYDTFVHQHLGLYQALQDAEHPLHPEQQKMRSDFLLNCQLAGIDLPDQQRAQVEQVFKRLHELSEQFENQVIDSQEKFNWQTTELADLDGLPQHVIANAKQESGGYVLTLDQPTYFAVVTYAKQRELRKIFFKAYNARASDKSIYDQFQYDNSTVIQEILNLRQELAELVGMKHYLEYSLSTKMAKSPARVETFLKDLLNAVLPIAKQDMQTLTEFANSQGFSETLEPWDLAYYSNLRQQHLFNIDQEALRVYFPLPHVMQALNQLLEALYQIRLEQVHDQDVWHPEVEVFALKQRNQTLGLLYCDWFSRPGKRGGAWMDTLQSHTKNSRAIASLTCNFARPAPGQTPGLTHDEFTTLLHELGHCLHHLLSQAEFFSVSGVHGVEWDAVELPSQWMENWGWQADWIKIFSKHMQTNNPIPDDLFQQMLAVKNDLVGLFLLRQLLFASYDVMIHQHRGPKNPKEVTEQYFALLHQYAVWPIDQDQRFPQAFSHIFAGGYAAGYYSYLWAEVLAADIFSWFEEHLPDVSRCGQAFLQQILSKGGSIPALSAFVNLMGREPNPQALLKHYGL